MLYNLLMSKIIRKRQKVITILIVFIVVFISYLILAHVNSNVFKFIRNNNNNFDTVFIITVDTLRKDHVSSYGYPYKTTPFIDMISKEIKTLGLDNILKLVPTRDSIKLEVNRLAIQDKI